MPTAVNAPPTVTSAAVTNPTNLESPFTWKVVPDAPTLPISATYRGDEVPIPTKS